MHEVRLWSLAVVMATVADSSVRNSAGDSSGIKETSGSISVLGDFVVELRQDECILRYLIEGGENVVSELDLGDGNASSSCEAD